MDENIRNVRELIITTGNSIELTSYINSKYRMWNIEDVYHYTDITGFISIIQNKEFWLSHIRFMNDRKEYIEGRELCKKIINIISKNINQIDFLKNILNELDSDISTGFFARTSKDVFSLSLSHSRDSLDMWRGYGKNSGIAIGFDFKACSGLPGVAMMRKEQYDSVLEQYNGNPEEVMPDHERLFFARNIIYNDKIKEDIISEIINITLEHLEYLEALGVMWAKKSALDLATNTLFDIFPYLKNEGFKNEDECRIIENYIQSSNEVPLKVYYRERNGLALPYIKYVLLDRNCRPLKQLPIKEIVIGPGVKQKDVKESIRYFLQQQNLNELAEKVVCSKIPYIAT